MLGGFEVKFGRGAEGVGAVLVDEGAGGFEHGGGGAFGELEAPFFFGVGQPIDEFFTGQDGGGGHGVIAFSFGLLAEFDFSSFGHQGALQHDGIGELIAQGGRTLGLPLAEVLDDARMAPGEEAVEIANLFVKRIVFLRRDNDDLADQAGGGTYNIRHFADLGVGADRFAVADAGFEELAGDGVVRVGAGDDERTEKIALAAFIDAEVRGEAFGVVEVLVAEAGFAEDFGFQGELDEVCGLLALDHRLGAFFIDGHGQAGFLPEIKGVGPGLEFESLPFDDAAQLVRLLDSQGHGVGAERRHGSPRRCKRSFLHRREGWASSLPPPLL